VRGGSPVGAPPSQVRSGRGQVAAMRTDLAAGLGEQVRHAAVESPRLARRKARRS